MHLSDFDISKYDRRESDKEFLCRLAKGTISSLSAFWNWVDKRQIDAYIISTAIVVETFVIAEWAMDFVNAHPDIDGLKAAAIIGSITGPWSMLQAAAIKFMFDARKESFEINGTKTNGTKTQA